MLTWRPDTAHQFDLIASERRATERAIVTAIWIVRRAVLTRYWLTETSRRVRGQR